MNRIKSLGLMFIGAIAGVAVVLAATPVRAQLGQSRPARLMITGRPYESRDSFGNPMPPQQYNGDWSFISDSKSGGCWLMMRDSQSGISLSPAPTSACQ